YRSGQGGRMQERKRRTLALMSALGSSLCCSVASADVEQFIAGEQADSVGPCYYEERTENSPEALICQTHETEEESVARQSLSTAAYTAICSAAVAIAVGLGCSAIAADCALGTALTVGNLAIPCVL